MAQWAALDEVGSLGPPVSTAFQPRRHSSRHLVLELAPGWCGPVPIVAELEARTGGRQLRRRSTWRFGVWRPRRCSPPHLESPEESDEPYPRRYFALTESALEPPKETRQAFLSLWDGLEPALDD